MKKIIPFILFLILFSCSEKVKIEQSVISGKFIGATDDNIVILGNSFEKKIALYEDGSFMDTLKLPYSGTFMIKGYNQPLYLELGKNLEFNINIEKPDENKFSGDLALENNYLAEKQKIRIDILGKNIPELYSLDENDFLKKINKFVKKTEELLNKTTFNSPNFKELEDRNVKFTEVSLLQNYPLYHAYFTDNEYFKVSDSFPKIDENIDYDNASDYNFSPAYQNIVQFNFDKNISNDVEQGSKHEEALIRNIKAIKSQNIKNSLLKNSSYYVGLASDDIDNIYNEFITLSTDEEFKKDLTEKYNKLKFIAKGKPSPKFNYENHKGGTTSLDDLKGKYVYVDVWATWCGPCIGEIPALKKIEEKYRDKNIEFVSISIDNTKDHEKWKTFVNEKNLQGIQLFADNAWQSQFVKDYVIEGIPRFILIGPDGNIISGDAPRPSDEELITLFNEYNI